MSNLSVYCLKYAESVLSENMVFVNGDMNKNIPISFAIYLIKTKDRNILVDAGCNTMPNFDMYRYYSPLFVLRQFDLTVNDITDVIITHSHHDHIEVVNFFKNAVVHISKKENEIGKRYISDDIKVNIFEEEYVMNSHIKVVEIGGHSKGSSVVEIKTDDTVHILAGDECYTNENIVKKVCTGTFFNKEKSMEFIKKYSNKKFSVHTCHDINLKIERVI